MLEGWFFGLLLLSTRGAPCLYRCYLCCLLDRKMRAESNCCLTVVRRHRPTARRHDATAHAGTADRKFYFPRTNNNGGEEYR